MSSTIDRFLHDVQAGEHALLVFATPQQRVEALRGWVEAGLAANERTLLIAHPDTPETMRSLLHEVAGYEEAVARGQLLVFPGKSFHEDLGPPTHQGLLDLHRKLVEEAQRDGYAGVRAGVDVTYFTETGVDEGLERFESAVGTRFPFALRLLCLMDGRRESDAGRHAEHHTHGRVLLLSA